MNDQLPLEPELVGITERIDPRDLVTLMPGIDAICEAGRAHDCGYPFCTCFQAPEEAA